jgi:hypothetical protein
LDESADIEVDEVRSEHGGAAGYLQAHDRELLARAAERGDKSPVGVSPEGPLRASISMPRPVANVPAPRAESSVAVWARAMGEDRRRMPTLAARDRMGRSYL